ncbi:hypothetical protein CVU75_01945, partial [Candidatus Dependentiae bacterium HGW-Dependentiae-1]
MNHSLKKCLGLGLLASMNLLHAANNCPVAPYYSIRSQSENNPRLFVGQAQLFNLHDMKNVYGNFAVTTEYTRSMRPGQIAENIFGESLYGKRMLKIKGSALPRNEQKDLLANYFYLSDYYDGTLCLTPRIQNFLVDLNLYLGLGMIAHGMYWRIHAPLVWTKWSLQAEETIINNGNITGSAYFNQNVTSFFDYACRGKSAPQNIYNGTAYPLGAARICPCSQRKTAVSDIQMDLGWNFASTEDNHIGLYMRGVAPTGTRPEGRFLFEPIVGNGKFWEIGGGIDARWLMWRSDEDNRELGLYFDASITHMLTTKQKRVFDLKKHGPLSRYMLLYNHQTVGSANANVTPAANVTLTNVNVSVAVQADVMLMFNYTRDNFNWDFGYNFWTRSCEKINCCKLESCQVCDHSNICHGLNGKTWVPLNAESTIHTEGTGTATPLTKADLNIEGAQTKGLSNKFFTNIGYTWWNHDDRVIPFLGTGFEVEFGKRPSCCKNNCNNNCCLPNPCTK